MTQYIEGDVSACKLTLEKTALNYEKLVDHVTYRRKFTHNYIRLGSLKRLRALATTLNFFAKQVATILTPTRT